MKKWILSAILIAFCMRADAGEPARPQDVLNDKYVFDQLLDLSGSALANVKKAVKNGRYDHAAKQYLQFRRTASSARWFDVPKPNQRLARRYRVLGDSVCMNYLRDDLNPRPYVPGWVYMGQDFDWEYNPLSVDDPNYSYEWSWMIVQRMSFLNLLRQAYINTGDEKYAAKAMWFIRDFLKDNMFDAYTWKGETRSPWRGLEVSIRMNHLINTYFAFRNSPSFTPEDQMTITKLAYLHGARLETIIVSDTVRSGNHVTTECRGLYAIGAVFPELERAEKWRDIALKRFIKEIDRVVPPDGFQAELSPSYHYGVASVYKIMYDIATLNDLPLPDGFRDKLVGMYLAPVMVADQSGNYVPTNDASKGNVSRHSTVGYEVEQHPILAWSASNGKKGTPPPLSVGLEYAGFYAMRSGWDKDDLFLFFRGGPEGIGHAEQDMLQVVLRAWNKTLLFDPGKYNYDKSQWRRYAINTPAHNTIIVDGKFQYREDHKNNHLGQFTPVGNPWIVSPLFDYVEATYDQGYRTNIYDPSRQYRPQRWLDDCDKSVTHTRKVLYLKPYYVLVTDHLDGTGQHTYDAHFHMDAPSAVIDPATQMSLSRNKGDVQLALFPLERDGLTAEVIQGQEEPMLGWFPSEHRPTPTTRFRKQQQAPTSFVTMLYPHKGSVPEFESSVIPVENASAYALKTTEEQAEIVIGHQSLITGFASDMAGTVRCKAQGVVIRRPKGQSAYYGSFWGGNEYSDERLSFSLSRTSSVVFSLQDDRILMYNNDKDGVNVTIGKPFAVTVDLPAGKWLRIGADGNEIVASPEIFKPFIRK